MNADYGIIISAIIALLPMMGALLLIPESMLAKIRGKIAVFLIFWGFAGSVSWVSYQFKPMDYGGWIIPLVVALGLTLYILIKKRLRFPGG